MIQTFEVRSDPASGEKHLPLLRQWMEMNDLDAVIVPRTDEQQNEDLAAYAERLAWLSGFTGSAGSLVVMKDKAAIFVDGRYTLQVRHQVNIDLIDPQDLIKTPPHKWLAGQLASGDRLGIDPWLHGIGNCEALETMCKKAGAVLVHLDQNPIDAIWADQPERPANPVYRHPVRYAGQSAEEKIAQVQNALKEQDVDFTIISQADSIAWLFNLRGSDIPRSPLFLATTIVPAKGKPILAIDPAKLDAELTTQLKAFTSLIEPSGFLTTLGNISGNPKFLIDKSATPAAISATLEGAGVTIIYGKDPCTLPKARKNTTELSGVRVAHQRDGIAMVKFLAWLDEAAAKGELDEITAAEQLEQFRQESGYLRDLSFETISGAGPNGAIIHYRVNTQTNHKLLQNSLYLVDSGGQYEDGTTDITRTIAIGTPDKTMRRNATLVLKGMIAITRSRFPAGTAGIHIDAFARQALWQAGLDYAHGTGHGVGAYLNCHEGPQSISKSGSVPLETGMIVSNEPGYYLEGQYGIRLENLLVVEEPTQIDGGEIAMHSFETLTLCPFDKNLVDVTLLNSDEINWLNDYHEVVFANLSPELDDNTRNWLAEATKPLHKQVPE